MVKSCNYGYEAVVNSVLRDQIVLGVASEAVREKLLYEGALTLPAACAIVRACEASSAQLSQIASRPDAQVHGLKGRATKDRQQQQQQYNRPRFGGNYEETSCNDCGRRHGKGQCFAEDAKCYACGKTGHYSRRCTKSTDHQQKASQSGCQMPPTTHQQSSTFQRRPAQRNMQRLHSMDEEGVQEQEDVRYLDEEYVMHELKISSDGEE